MCDMQPLCRSMKGVSKRGGRGGYDGAHRGGATPNWSARALRSRRASGFTGRKLSRLVGAIDSTRGQEVMRPVLGIVTRVLFGATRRDTDESAW